MHIPDSIGGHRISSIGDYAFARSSRLTSVEIPLGISKIGANPFAGCDSLDEITVSPDHEYLATIDGVLFSKADKRLVSYCPKVGAAAYSVPRGIKCIGQDAFDSCENLKIIELPDTISEIGDDAFHGCENLRTISLPDGLSAFGQNPFSGCHSLEEIMVSAEHPILSVVDGVLFDNVGNRLVVAFDLKKEAVEHYVVPDGIEVIDESAFAKLEMLKSISIPESVREIRDQAFCSCRGLTEIILPIGVREIGKQAFSGCQCLKLVALQEGLTMIGDMAFEGCVSLRGIELPEGMAYVGAKAFCDDANLAAISIPASVIEIGEDAFMGCEILKATVARDSYARQYCIYHDIAFDYFDSLDWLLE